MKTFTRKLWAHLATLVVILTVAIGGLALESAVSPNYAQALTRTTATKTVKKTIGKRKAIAIALKKAKLKRSQVKRLEVELEREDGHKVYEVEFRCKGLKYEFDIDRYTGKVIDKDVKCIRRRS